MEWLWNQEVVRDCMTVEEHHRESLDFLEKFESRNLNFDSPDGKSSKGSEKCIILNSLSMIKGMY